MYRGPRQRAVIALTVLTARFFFLWIAASGNSATGCAVGVVQVESGQPLSRATVVVTNAVTRTSQSVLTGPGGQWRICGTAGVLYSAQASFPYPRNPCIVLYSDRSRPSRLALIGPLVVNKSLWVC